MATFFVSNTGDNANDGSISNPFQTIQHAADVAVAGDTVNIREGVYREQVNLQRSGTEADPIVFQAFNGEDVTVTATDVLTGFTRTPETTDNNNVYVATLEGSTTNPLFNSHELTVFVDGELVQAAKNRNSADYLRSNTWSTVNSTGGNGTTITDTDLVGVGNLTGGFIRVRLNDFAITIRRIVAHDVSSGTITLESSVGNVNGRDYLAHDAQSLVDSPGEWYFNEETNQFFIWIPDGGDPDNATVEVKRRAEAFDTNGNDYLHFRGLTLTGGDFETFVNNAFNGPQSNGLLIEDVHVIAPDRNFSPDFGTTRTSLNFSGNDNVVRNSEFEQIWSVALRIRGSNNQFVNNYVHDAAFNGGGSGGIASSGNSTGNLISHNTFTRHGRSAIVVRDTQQDLIQHNDFSEVALITEDTGAIYIFNGNLGGSEVRFNTFRNIDARLSTGFYIDNFATDVAFYNNVSFDTPAFGFKANQPNAFVLQYNNTAFQSGRLDVVFPELDSEYGSRFYNNIVSTIDGDAGSGNNPLDIQNNFVSGASGNFLNANGGDFRLRASSGAVDAGRVIPGITDGFSGSAPDAGAYELGSALFATGHDFGAPPSPVYDIEGPVFGANLVRNGSFERGFDQFDVTGNPTTFDEIASNFGSSGLNRFGFKGARLEAGDAVTQTVTGLNPNTTYTLSGFAKPIRQIVEAESLNTSLSTRTTTSILRGQVTISGIQNNDQLVYDAIDFGNGDQFDQITLQVAQTSSSTSVEVRLDSPAGQLIGSTNLGLGNNNPDLVASSAEIDITDVITGSHQVYLVFSGGSGNLGQLESIRFSNSADRAHLTASNFGGDDVSRSIGSRTFEGEFPRVTFTTGPNSTSAEVGIRVDAGSGVTAYTDYLSLVERDDPGSEFAEVDLVQTSFNYDLGTIDSPVLISNNRTFSRITPDVWGDISFSGGAVRGVDRGSISGINAANRDFVGGTEDATFNHSLVNGIYRITVNLSDPFSDLDNQFVRAEGVLEFSDIDRAIGENGALNFEVEVLDGELNLEFGDADTVNPRWAVNRIGIDQLEVFQEVDLDVSTYFYDLGAFDSVLFNNNVDNYIRLGHNAYGDISFTGGNPDSFDRGQGPNVNNINRDGVIATGSTTLNHVLPNGTWQVLVNIGDLDFARDDITITAEDVVVASNVDRNAGAFGPNIIFDVTVTDGELNLKFDDLGGVNDDISLTRLILRQRPEVASVVINSGESQRSKLDELVVTFSGEVNLGSGAFSVLQRSDLSGATGTSVDTSFTTEVINGNTVATIVFDSLTRGTTGALVDGNYQLTINRSAVTDAENNLAMDQDFVFGDTEADGFFSLYGSSNGSRTVNVFNLLDFRQSFRLSAGDSGFDASLDFDGNGTINVFDLLAFRQRFRQTLQFV